MNEFIPWHKRNPENAAKMREYKRINRAAYVERNQELVRERGKKYYQNNKSKFRAREVAHVRKLKQASVLAAGLFPQIEEFYKEARRLTEETGVNHVVDHYWPINGKVSCGLHVPWNLRVITQTENDSKGNKEPEDTWASVPNMEIHNAVH
jgi:hypothetical protein